MSINLLDIYMKNIPQKEIKSRLLPNPVLKKDALKWIKIHRGAYVGDLHDFLIFNWRSKNKIVLGERITDCLRELLGERMIRVRKFALIHKFAMLYPVNKRK